MTGGFVNQKILPPILMAKDSVDGVVVGNKALIEQQIVNLIELGQYRRRRHPIPFFYQFYDIRLFDFETMENALLSGVYGDSCCRICR